MDAHEDNDVKLQRASADLLADLQRSLPIILWRTTKSKDSHVTRRVRRNVRSNDIERLIKLLEPFQEWPQLLDPHLANLLPHIVEAFLESVTARQRQNSGPGANTLAICTNVSMPRAICRLLYTFCKIRGEKVISRFLNNEPKYLEPLLDVFEVWDNSQTVRGHELREQEEPMTWYERYIILLWLSHLLLAPFDLDSISSTGHREDTPENVLEEEIISKLPGISRRLLPICFKYLFSASKEREATCILLVRLCIRPDMRQLGMLQSMMHWASTTLEVQPNEGSSVSIYEHIGVLSFISGLLVSADKDIIGPFLLPIFELTRRILNDNGPTFKNIRSSALARKILIKISRLITVLTLQHGFTNYIPEDGVSQILEDVIDQLLNALADKDTPVRYAASKAISVIATALQPHMAADVVDAVIGSMQEDMLWEDETRGVSLTNVEITMAKDVSLKRNFGAVNPLRWHGLTLTVAHILFRRSAAPHQVPDILNALILALGFEQRSSSRSSIGTNVRDSACFGIWSLARRYSTAELADVDSRAICAANSHEKAMPVLQVLAIELTVSAALDPSGNIRRGSSAALQELIGRHPDTIIEGISIVQVVDYHAVALRSRAVTEVLVDSAKLGEIYWDAMFDGLLGWRGIGSPDTDSRRLASRAIGLLSSLRGKSRTNAMFNRILEELLRLHSRGYEQRHGLLLSLAEIVECSLNATDLSTPIQSNTCVQILADVTKLWAVFSNDSIISKKDFMSASSKPELLAEAVCRLISNLARWTHERSIRMPSEPAQDASISVLSLCLNRTEEVVIELAAKAAKDLLSILSIGKRAELVNSWLASLSSIIKAQSVSGNRGIGYIAALGATFTHFNSKDDSSGFETQRELIVQALVTHTAPDTTIECRVIAINSLATGIIASGVITQSIVEALQTSLEDYTVDQRGDIGSLVRIAAIDAVATASRFGVLDSSLAHQDICASIFRLAAEKLDKVRIRAWSCVGVIRQMHNVATTGFDAVDQVSSYEYFLNLLDLVGQGDMRLSLLEGYVTSASSGSESILVSSRSALVDFAEHQDRVRNLSDDLVEVLQRKNSYDRIAIPAMDVLVYFLFDTAFAERMEDFDWCGLIETIRKLCVKTKNARKLEAAVRIYAGLVNVEETKRDAMVMLLDLLNDRFAQVRNAVADALWIATEIESLKGVDWTTAQGESKKQKLEPLKLEILRRIDITVVR